MISVSLPAGLLAEIDRAVAERGTSRSALLQQGARLALDSEPDRVASALQAMSDLAARHLADGPVDVGELVSQSRHERSDQLTDVVDHSAGGL